MICLGEGVGWGGAVFVFVFVVDRRCGLWGGGMGGLRLVR